MTTLAVDSNKEPLAKRRKKENVEVLETANEVETSLKFDIVGHLPPEVAQQILFHLSSEDLHSATFCCSSWNAAVNDNYFWKRKCERDGYLEVEESNRSEFYTNFLSRYNYWQGVYWYNDTLQRNWETNNYREVTYEINKQPDVCMFDLWNFGDLIAFSQLDVDGLNMHIYDLRRKEFKPTVFPIRDDRGNPSNLYRSGNYLIYNIVVHSLAVWDFVNETTIVDSEKWNDVTDVNVDKNLIMVQFYNTEFEVWEIETMETTYQYTGNFKNLILEDGKIIFLMTDTNVINVIKWCDKSIVPLTCCQSVSDRKLLVKNDFLLSFCVYGCNSNTTLCIWTTTTNTKLQSISLGPIHWDHWDYMGRGISLIDKYFYVKRYNGAEKNYVLEFWEYMKGTPKVAFVATINQNVDCSRNDNFLVSRDYSNIWSLRTKKFISIPNVTPADDQYLIEIELSKTMFTYFLKSSKKKYTLDETITMHVRDYEI